MATSYIDQFDLQCDKIVDINDMNDEKDQMPCTFDQCETPIEDKEVIPTHSDETDKNQAAKLSEKSEPEASNPTFWLFCCCMKTDGHYSVQWHLIRCKIKIDKLLKNQLSHSVCRFVFLFVAGWILASILFGICLFAMISSVLCLIETDGMSEDLYCGYFPLVIGIFGFCFGQCLTVNFLKLHCSKYDVKAVQLSAKMSAQSAKDTISDLSPTRSQ